MLTHSRSTRRPLVHLVHCVLRTALALGGASSALAQGLAPAPEGNVRFQMIAQSGFDPYVTQSTPSTRTWMLGNYQRMQVYTPFFDAHTAWYPNAWVYKDLYAIKPDWPVFAQHPEWVLRDAGGALLYIPWGCSGGTCPQYAGDIGNPAFRAWWIDEALELYAAGYRGFWIDDVNMTWRVGNGSGEHVTPIDPRTGTLMTLADWRRYMAEFVEAIRAALPEAELVHNVVWYAAPIGDPFQERQIAASTWQNFERGVNDLGLVAGNGQWSLRTYLAFLDYVHSRGRGIVMQDYAPGVHQREYGLAGYLLMNTGRDLVATDHIEWCAPGSWWRPYKLGLGPALGPRQDWNGWIRRDFARGIVVVSEPGQAPATHALGGAFRDLDGNIVTSVQLGDRDAKILLRL